MKSGSFPNRVVVGTAAFTVRGFRGKGQVLDLTLPGCIIDTALSSENLLSPQEGDLLTLRVSLLQTGATFHIVRGVVRWARGSRFRVEFIEMDQMERQGYNAFVATCLGHQAASLVA